MDYRKHHDLIVNRAKKRILNEYCEKHHIIPHCMGGCDDAKNIVALTPREHYIIHQLLVKMYPGVSKLVYAANMLSVDANGERINNRRYKWIKEKVAKAQSKARKGKTYEELFGVEEAKKQRILRSENSKGSNNNFYGKKHTKEVRKSLSIIKKDLYKDKLNHPRIGAIITNEHKAILSKAHKGKKLTKETRQKMSESRLNNKNGSGNKGKQWSAARRLAYEKNKAVNNVD